MCKSENQNCLCADSNSPRQISLKTLRANTRLNQKLPGLAYRDAPSILNRSYTITAEVDVPALTATVQASRWCCSTTGDLWANGPLFRPSPGGIERNRHLGGSASRRSRPDRRTGCCSHNSARNCGGPYWRSRSASRRHPRSTISCATARRRIQRSVRRRPADQRSCCGLPHRQSRSRCAGKMTVVTTPRRALAHRAACIASSGT